MSPNDDPLWYDRVEPDEPLNAFAVALISIFAVAEFICVGFAGLYRLLKGGAKVAFQDINS